MGLHNEPQTHAHRKRTSEVESRRTKEKAFWKGGERSLKPAPLLVKEDHQGHWRSQSTRLLWSAELELQTPGSTPALTPFPHFKPIPLGQDDYRRIRH